MDQGVGFNFSLKKICKQRLKGAFVSLLQANPNIQNYLLVVDEKTVKVVSAYMNMAELMDLGISAVEKLELGRKPFPKLNAIYLISPSEKSIQALIDDYKDKKNPQYGSVHILLSNEIEQNLMQKIAHFEPLISRVATFRIINLDFTCAGDQVFSVEMKQCLTVGYSDKNFAIQGILKESAYKLSTLLISFNKFYSFEFIYNLHENKLSEQISRMTAFRLQELFQSFIKSKNEQYDNIEKEAGKITILVVDRSFDPATPLLHDYFYQPMIYDLLDINNDVFEHETDLQGKQVIQKVILTQNDDLFKRYKYKHIGQVLDGVPAEFKEFINNSTTAKVHSGQMNNLDLKQMSEIVKTLPQYNELLAKYTLHMKIIEKSWGIFQTKDLKEIGELEQTLATGIDKDGKVISSSKVLSQVGTKLLNDSLDSYDKLRLMLLTTIALELNEKDRKILTDQITFEHQKAILNLIYLGISPQKGGSKKTKTSNRVSEDLKKQAKNRMSTATMDLCRNTPLIESLVESLVETNFKKPNKFDTIKLNEDGMSILLFYRGNKSNSKSLRKKGGQLAKMMQNEDDDDTINAAPKLVIFVVGGISYSEIRSILINQKIVNNQITIVGSTQLMKPKDYCDALLSFKTD